MRAQHHGCTYTNIKAHHHEISQQVTREDPTISKGKTDHINRNENQNGFRLTLKMEDNETMPSDF